MLRYCAFATPFHVSDSPEIMHERSSNSRKLVPVIVRAVPPCEDPVRGDGQAGARGQDGGLSRRGSQPVSSANRYVSVRRRWVMVPSGMKYRAGYNCKEVVKCSKYSCNRRNTLLTSQADTQYAKSGNLRGTEEDAVAVVLASARGGARRSSRSSGWPRCSSWTTSTTPPRTTSAPSCAPRRA